MSGIFQTFNVAKLGMQAQQNAINTTSHNISNANTEGFSRQRVNLQTTQPYTYAGIGQIGTGVEIVSITRTRDEFLDAQIRFENAIGGRFESMETVLEQVEMVFLEPSDTGLNALLDDFWTSWQELSKAPENSNAKTIVAQSARTLADAVNHMDGQMETLKADTATLQASRVYDANALLGQINDLNEQIYKIKLKGLEPNDLMDRRDLLVDRLSSIVSIRVEEDPTGTIAILNRETGAELLGANPRENPEVVMSTIQSAVFDEAVGTWTLTIARGGDRSDVHTVTLANPDENAFTQGDVLFTAPEEDWTDGTLSTLSKPALKDGALAGNCLAVEAVEAYQASLDALVNGIAQSVNEIHEAVDGTAFFETLDGAALFTAENLSVNGALLDDPTLIEAAQAADSPPGDGSRALAIAQLRNGRYPVGDAAGFEAYVAAHYDGGAMAIASEDAGTTFDSFYKDIVAKIGIDSQSARRGSENQGTLLLQLNQRKESVSGVSMDEEVANLIQYQTAYQANAKVMATLTEMLDTLIHGLGV